MCKDSKRTHAQHRVRLGHLSDGPACTARLAHPIATSLEVSHLTYFQHVTLRFNPLFMDCHAIGNDRPRRNWLCTIEQELRPLNIGLVSAWQRAQDRERWKRTVETATLQDGACSWWWWWCTFDVAGGPPGRQTNRPTWHVPCSQAGQSAPENTVMVDDCVVLFQVRRRVACLVEGFQATITPTATYRVSIHTIHLHVWGSTENCASA